MFRRLVSSRRGNTGCVHPSGFPAEMTRAWCELNICDKQTSSCCSGAETRAPRFSEWLQLPPLCRDRNLPGCTWAPSLPKFCPDSRSETPRERPGLDWPQELGWGGRETPVTSQMPGTQKIPGPRTRHGAPAVTQAQENTISAPENIHHSQCPRRGCHCCSRLASGRGGGTGGMQRRRGRSCQGDVINSFFQHRTKLGVKCQVLD